MRSVAFASLGVNALAYSFWGINVGSQSYDGSPQLTFSGVGNNVQYVVGGYQYTEVNSSWYGPFAAASPGAGYVESAECQTDGLFFTSDGTNALFEVITGSPQNGFTAGDIGYGSRQFGPGDLKIDVGTNTYGLGMRVSNLTWNLGPTNQPEFQIYESNGSIASLNARNTGTKGDVELNPQWDHVDHSGLSPNCLASTAFFVSGSGTSVGSDAVSFTDTGMILNGAELYAYQVSVPLATLGLTGANYSFDASWRPDCGNDVISSSFCGTNNVNHNCVPEPTSLLLAGLGMAGVGLRRLRLLG